MPSPLQILGILNVTPDSYFDGGRFNSVERAVARAEEMLTQGADIIEVGGESTGPGSSDISIEEELKRTIPVITAIKKAFPTATLAIDTWKADVARQAIDLGVAMVNDVTAGRGDPAMFEVIASSRAAVVLMYSKDDSPRATIADTQYEDVIATVIAFLTERKQQALKAGVSEDRIILDPGLGHFVSSDPRYSYDIIARLQELKRELRSPILLSPSRKSFLAGVEQLKTNDRLPGTIAASAIAVLHGAEYIRTHDVLEVCPGCEVALEVRKRVAGSG